MHTPLLDTIAVLFALASVFAYLNHRFLRLPFTIGMLLSALGSSLALLAIDWLWPQFGIGAAVRG